MDIIKYDMTDIWASAGDVVAPDSAKIAQGWGVEVVPRQWWNWFENRQDNNLAYMLQKGFPEWDATTEYIINKSYVQRAGIVYKATATSTNSDPIALTSWVRAFADYSVSLNALGALTPAANQLPYFNNGTTAALTTLSPYGRTLIDDVDASAARTTLDAQQTNVNLTSLSGVTAVANGLPYFTGTTAMGITTLTAFGRSLIDDTDSTAARITLGVYSTAQVDSAIAASAATLQPLDATLTALAGLTTGNNLLPYFNGVDSAATTAITTFARSLLDDADAATARTTLGAQTLDATLTALAGLATAADQMIYSTGVDTFAMASLTPYGRSLLDDADATAARSTLGLGTAAVRNTTSTGNVIAEDTPTGAAQITKGTTVQRPTGVSGLFRFNTDTNRFEGYNSTAWGSLGGATGGGNDDAFYENTTTITTNYTITTGKNAGSFGPITIADGVTVTVPTGSTWSIV